jgi:predicted nucleic acid-binding protein
MSVKPGRIAVDTNVVLYVASDDDRKIARAKDVLALEPIISVQVLNEVTNVCHRKFRMSWAQLDRFIETTTALCYVVPVTVNVYDEARRLAERYEFSIWDAGIVASALIAGCDTLYTEDMQHGLVVDGRLTLVNPFL